MRAVAVRADVDPALRSRLAAHVREVADFPTPGVRFKDITPLLADPGAFRDCVEALAAPWREAPPTVVCGIEARGFIFGAAVAHVLGAGFVPLRKAGKLPGATCGVEFRLEYGTAKLEIHADAFAAGARALLVDDVLATGGTLAAGAELVRGLGAQLVGASVVIELDFLAGRSRWLLDLPLRALLHY